LTALDTVSCGAAGGAIVATVVDVGGSGSGAALRADSGTAMSSLSARGRGLHATTCVHTTQP